MLYLECGKAEGPALDGYQDVCVAVQPLDHLWFRVQWLGFRVKGLGFRV